MAGHVLNLGLSGHEDSFLDVRANVYRPAASRDASKPRQCNLITDKRVTRGGRLPHV